MHGRHLCADAHDVSFALCSTDFDSHLLDDSHLDSEAWPAGLSSMGYTSVMSADNLVAVLEVAPDRYLVTSAVSFYPEQMTRDEILSMFETAVQAGRVDSGEFTQRSKALDFAHKVERSEAICEYGVCIFTLNDAGYQSFDELPAIDRAQRMLMDRPGSMGFNRNELSKLTAQLVVLDQQKALASLALESFDENEILLLAEIVDSDPETVDNAFAWGSLQPLRQRAMAAGLIRESSRCLTYLTVIGAQATLLAAEALAKT